MFANQQSHRLCPDIPNLVANPATSCANSCLKLAHVVGRFAGCGGDPGERNYLQVLVCYTPSCFYGLSKVPVLRRSVAIAVKTAALCF